MKSNTFFLLILGFCIEKFIEWVSHKICAFCAGEEVLYSHLITINCHKWIIYNDIILCLIMHKIMNYDQWQENANMTQMFSATSVGVLLLYIQYTGYLIIKWSIFLHYFTDYKLNYAFWILLIFIKNETFNIWVLFVIFASTLKAIRFFELYIFKYIFISYISKKNVHDGTFLFLLLNLQSKIFRCLQISRTFF